jgi:hypothetical protein
MQSMILRTCFVAALTIPASSWAWDEEVGAVAPKLNGTLPAHTTIDRIDVLLQGRAISLTYHGQQRDKSPQKLVLSSYSPPFTWQGAAADYPDLHFPELSIQFNGDAGTYTAHAIALFDGEPVTDKLKSAGVDPLRVALAEEAPVDPKTVRGKEVRKLFSTGVTHADNIYPLWHVIYSRKWAPIPLPKGPFSIQVTYNSRPAKIEVSTNGTAFAAAVLAHCGSLDQVKPLLRDSGGNMPDSVLIETTTVPLPLANIAPTSTFISTSSARTPRPGLRLASTLACGPEDVSLLGQPHIASSRAKTSSSLSVLNIFIQS